MSLAWFCGFHLLGYSGAISKAFLLCGLCDISLFVQPQIASQREVWSVCAILLKNTFRMEVQVYFSKCMITNSLSEESVTRMICITSNSLKEGISSCIVVRVMLAYVM